MKTPRIPGRKHYFWTFQTGTALLTSKALAMAVAVALVGAIAGVGGLELALEATEMVAIAVVGYQTRYMAGCR